ncbi:MAG: hypothetical protein AAF587_06160 [Bacteroidota bacterium]
MNLIIRFLLTVLLFSGLVSGSAQDAEQQTNNTTQLVSPDSLSLNRSQLPAFMLSIYPTSYQLLLKVRFSRRTTEALEWRIVNSEEKIIRKGPIKVNQTKWSIDIKNLPSGAYMLHIGNTEQGFRRRSFDMF